MNARDSNDVKDEYRDASANMRHYGSMRFAVLTLLSAMTAGLLALLFGKQDAPSGMVRDLLKGGGLAVTCAFFIMEKRATGYLNHYKQRAVELEKTLGYQQHTHRPEKAFVTSAKAVMFLYGVIFLFWLFALIGRL